MEREPADGRQRDGVYRPAGCCRGLSQLVGLNGPVEGAGGQRMRDGEGLRAAGGQRCQNLQVGGSNKKVAC